MSSDKEKYSHQQIANDSSDSESATLLSSDDDRPHRQCPKSYKLVLYASLTFNALSVLVAAIVLQYRLKTVIGLCDDPSLSIYSPANEAVEYVAHQHFRAALFNNTPFMGFPSKKQDQLWSDLYNFGISSISESEAQNLANPTLPIPGTNDYLIELDVWHELHCLNDLRKTFYPEYYPNASLAGMTLPNGTINRDNNMFRHWDHCIDSIRQTLMCHADVAPIPFHVNVPANTGIFPRLATTHTCRNFTKLQEWAKSRSAGEWKYLFDTPQEAEALIASSSHDQGPEENIQELYYLFPGNQYFDYWKTHKQPEQDTKNT